MERREFLLGAWREGGHVLRDGLRLWMSVQTALSGRESRPRVAPALRLYAVPGPILWPLLAFGQPGAPQPRIGLRYTILPAGLEDRDWPGDGDLYAAETLRGARLFRAGRPLCLVGCLSPSRQAVPRWALLARTGLIAQDHPRLLAALETLGDGIAAAHQDARRLQPVVAAEAGALSAPDAGQPAATAARQPRGHAPGQAGGAGQAGAAGHEGAAGPAWLAGPPYFFPAQDMREAVSQHLAQAGERLEDGFLYLA